MLVSAIITTHNRASLLPRAIESVLAQTYSNIEIIVVDDGSNDETEKVIHDYMGKYPHIRYLKNDFPKGACAARNHGIREARGEFIAGLDDDDEWLPRRVEVLLKHFRDEYAYVCSRDCVVYPDKIKYKSKKSVITLEDMFYQNVTGNQILTKRERILAVGGFDETLTSGQDYDLWLRLLEKYGSAKMVAEPLQRVYRNHECERISSSGAKIKGQWLLYLKHKPKMNRRQKLLQLIEIKRLKGKNIHLAEIMPLVHTEYFWKYMRLFLRKRFWHPLKGLLIKASS